MILSNLPDTIGEHARDNPTNLKFSVLIVSTMRYEEFANNQPSTDKTIAMIEPILVEHGYELANKEIVPDDDALIQASVDAFIASEEIDVLLTCGGTGISPRDMTIDVLTKMKAKVLPGFGELFRATSFQEVGPPAMLSRAEAFILHYKPIFCLPGSPKAVKLAIETLILPVIGHLLAMLRKIE